MTTKQRNELIEMHANIIMENYGKDERKHFMFEMEDTYTKKDDFLCALENHAYYSILVLVSRGGKRKLAKLVDEFWEEYQEANAEVEESEDEEDSDDEEDDDDDETIVKCKGCEKWIDNKTGFCSEGCNYAEIAGVWYCEKCSGRCEDCEFCPNCGKEEEEQPCVGCGSKKIKYTEMGGEKGVNMCGVCFGDEEEEDRCYRCETPQSQLRLPIIEVETRSQLFLYCSDCYEEEGDFATEWDKDLTTDERVALLAKTFDNKADSDDEEEEEETWRCEECDRNDMKEGDIGGHLVDGGCICNDCYKDEYNFCYKNAP